MFARRQQLGRDIEGYAHEIKIHALGRLGELLDAIPKATGGQPYQSTGTTKGPVEPTLADLGISKKESAVAHALANLPKKTRAAIAKRETTLAQVRREQRVADAANPDAMLAAFFTALVARHYDADGIRRHGERCRDRRPRDRPRGLGADVP